MLCAQISKEHLSDTTQKRNSSALKVNAFETSALFEESGRLEMAQTGAIVERANSNLFKSNFMSNLCSFVAEELPVS